MGNRCEQGPLSIFNLAQSRCISCPGDEPVSFNSDAACAAYTVRIRRCDTVSVSPTPRARDRCPHQLNVGAIWGRDLRVPTASRTRYECAELLYSKRTAASSENVAHA